MEKCCLQQAIERLGEGGDVSFSLSLSFSFSMRHSFDRYWFYRLELFYLLLSRWQKSWLFQVMMLQNCLISAGISRCCLSKPHQKCRETIECRVHAAIVYHYFLIEKKKQKKKNKKIWIPINRMWTVVQFDWRGNITWSIRSGEGDSPWLGRQTDASWSPGRVHRFPLRGYR